MYTARFVPTTDVRTRVQGDKIELTLEGYIQRSQYVCTDYIDFLTNMYARY